MRVLFGRTTVAALLSAGVVPQAPGPAPSFDLTDVFARPHSWTRMRAHMTGGTLRGRRYDIQNATLLDLISVAYAVDGRTVLGGPNWLDRNRFDIIAKAPERRRSQAHTRSGQYLWAWSGPGQRRRDFSAGQDSHKCAHECRDMNEFVPAVARASGPVIRR
jgi:hypothetical protein